MNVMIARKKKRFTQDYVCEKVKISRSTLSKIENGKDANVTKDVMLRLSKVLEVSVQELFFSEEQ